MRVQFPSQPPILRVRLVVNQLALNQSSEVQILHPQPMINIILVLILAGSLLWIIDKALDGEFINWGP